MTEGLKKNEPDARVVYADIIRLPHWQSPTRTPMSAYEIGTVLVFQCPRSATRTWSAKKHEGRMLSALSEAEMEILNQKINLIVDVLEDGHHPC